MRTFPIHPIAAAFPEMDAIRYAELKADIAAHGVHLSAITWRGQLIDGRHRVQACAELSIDCPSEERECNEEDLPSLVWSLNGQRRDLSPSQRAMIGARMAQMSMPGGDRTSTLSKDRMVAGPNRTARQAAEIVGVGSAQVSRALKVVRSGDEETITAVEKGEMTVGAAHARVRGLTAGHQPVIEGDPRRDRTIRYPRNERFVRAVEMIETATEVAAANITAIEGDVRRKQLLESLRQSRTDLTRIINLLEKVA